jgi:glycosyltransferase involved in cell wall biosynthesis
MAEDLPDVFRKKFGIHFLLPTWNVEGSRSRQIKNSIKAASEKMPGHVFVVVSSTEFETFLLGNENVPALFAHQAIFVDDRIWKISEQGYEELGNFDAVINARFDKMKRHELAAGIKSLLLIYAYSLDDDVESSTARIKGILPYAYFANHELKKARNYSGLSTAEIVKLYGHSQVGLCLSPEEGYSRASIEYLMCGLPVVSTKNIGGRDRYYFGKYCRIVPADEREIAVGVRELKELKFSRKEVRDHVLLMLNFDRENFVRNANRLVEHLTGNRDFFSSISPFLGIKQQFNRHSDILSRLKLDLEMNRPLPPEASASEQM